MATTPIPPPPPPSTALATSAAPAAADAVATPFSNPARQANAADSPRPAHEGLATARPPTADEELSTPPPPPTDEKPSTPPPPPFADEKLSTPPPPPPADEEPSSPTPAAAFEEPSSPPLPVANAKRSSESSLAADAKPSMVSPTAAEEEPSMPPPPTDAAAKPAPPREVRKLKRKAIIIRKSIPKDTSIAASDELVDKGHNVGEAAAKKPASVCDAVDAYETLLQEEMVRAGTLVVKLAANTDAREVEEGTSMATEKDELGMSERRRRMMTEVFVGGLNWDVEEEDVRAVFAKAEEITEVRMIVDAMTRKSKGYCFVCYRERAQAKKAIAELNKVKICGKPCRVEALDGSDKILLGNINKKWKKKDIMKLLQKIGVENIDTVTLMADSNNPGYNLGYAFLELETNRDALMAYRKLSRKGIFGRCLNITVAWAETLSDPDEAEMRKVKSVFVEGTPTSWDHAKMTEIFKKYGKIQRVVLSRDVQSSKRSDFAFVHYTTHEAAILCLESFDQEQLAENDSKVNIKVSLARPVRKGKQKKRDIKNSNSEKGKIKIAQMVMIPLIPRGVILVLDMSVSPIQQLQDMVHHPVLFLCVIHIIMAAADIQQVHLHYGLTKPSIHSEVRQADSS
ncbi:hypothetical protein ACP70R_015040 [Stipagrostis hirtigluma subsp. patula]